MLSFFPRDILDEILDLIESVSEGFSTYSFLFITWFINGDAEYAEVNGLCCS